MNESALILTVFENQLRADLV